MDERGCRKTNAKQVEKQTKAGGGKGGVEVKGEREALPANEEEGSALRVNKGGRNERKMDG